MNAGAEAERAIPLTTLGDTERLAREALAALPPGALLVLSGPLGSGKTTFTQALASHLGVAAPVTSPTYTLVHEYPSPEGPLVHLDAYRLAGGAGLAGAMLDDYGSRARLVVVEWGEGLLEAYPEAWQLAFSFTPAAPGAAGPAREARWLRTHGPTRVRMDAGHGPTSTAKERSGA